MPRKPIDTKPNGAARPALGAESRGPTRTQIIERRTASRRAFVASLMLTGRYTVNEIVEELAAHPEHSKAAHSERVIREDIQVNIKMWKESAIRTTEEWVNKEIARLDELEEVAVQKLREAGFVKERYDEESGELIERTFDSKAQNYIDAVLRIQERRARLLGLDQPQKVLVRSHQSHSVEDLSDEALERIIAAGGKQLTGAKHAAR